MYTKEKEWCPRLETPLFLFIYNPYLKSLRMLETDDAI